MKYANINWPNCVREDSDYLTLNIGDVIQFMAIEHLYDYMGIDSNDIVRISLKELKTYDGDEYLILPINYVLYEYYYLENGEVAISPKIIPVFLGVTFVQHNFSKSQIEYFKRFEPIGCRNEITMQELRKNGVMAYLNGCMTAALPKRVGEEYKNRKKVFLVDVPQSIYEYIPEDIKRNSECLTHSYCFPQNNIKNPDELRNFVKQQYKRYEEEAALVITMRLHAAAPCLAMGIPVILVKEEILHTFAWIDKFIPIYTKEDFKTIDWAPKPINYEAFKEKLLGVAAARVGDAFNKYKEIYEISEFYENRIRKDYQRDMYGSIFSKIDKYFKNNQEIEYAIWGAADIGEDIYSYISEKYPEATLVYVIDTYRDVDFHGLKSQRPDILKKDDKFITLVCSLGAMPMAMRLFKKIKKNNYLFVLDEFITEDEKRGKSCDME